VKEQKLKLSPLISHEDMSKRQLHAEIHITEAKMEHQQQYISLVPAANKKKLLIKQRK